MNCDIFTHVIDLKCSVPACVSKNSDGSYSIFLNSRLSESRLKDAYLHELNHIKNKDFEKLDVEEIESDAHDSGQTKP